MSQVSKPTCAINRHNDDIIAKPGRHRWSYALALLAKHGDLVAVALDLVGGQVAVDLAWLGDGLERRVLLG
eukprot:scaffold545910_cov26-Prasinocladus_malaysianus.AAC.1